MTTYPVQVQSFQIIGDGAVAGATSLTLASFNDILGNPLAMASFGNIGYGTIEPNTTNEDAITFTGITQNSNGTATLAGVNSVGFIPPYTASTGLRISHAGSVPFIITNTAAWESNFANKQNAEVITANWAVPDPVNSTDIANKEYVLSVVNGGPVTTSTVNVAGISGESISAGNFVYLNTDGNWYKTDATTGSKINNVIIGIAQGSGTALGAISGGVLIKGIDTHQSGLVAGTVYYLSNTPGAISTSSGTIERKIGIGYNTTSIDFDPNYAYIPTALQYAGITQFPSLTGVVASYAGRSAPTGWLLCDGTAVSRSTYAALMAVICPSGAFTVTIATPAVFTKNAHGLIAGDPVSFTTTGGLPSGLSTATTYYVISTGLTTNAFEVSLSPGGPAVNTSGSQSGVHTLYASAFGLGDGSTTFNVPDMRSRIAVGLAATAATTTLAFQGSQRSSNDITIPATNFPAQGQKVQLSTTGALPTGLSTSTDYYIIRNSSTSIAFATSQANANSSTKISLSADGSGVNTIIFTNGTHPVLGREGGEENHGIAISELAAHVHVQNIASASTGSNAPGSGSGSTASGLSTASTGGDSPHNNLQPYAVMNYIIKT